MKEYLHHRRAGQIFGMTCSCCATMMPAGCWCPPCATKPTDGGTIILDQVYLLATIRYLRKLGYSLEQAADFVASGDVSKNMDSMAAQADILQRRCQELLTTVDIIQKKIRFIQEETRDAKENSFRCKVYPDRQFLHIGEEIDLFTYEPFYFYPTVGFYTADRKWFGAYLFGDSGADKLLAETQAAADQIPGGNYLCGYHYGPYTTIRDSIGRLYQDGGKPGLGTGQLCGNAEYHRSVF